MINRNRILDMIADLPDEDLIEISVLVEKTFRKSCLKESRYCNYLSIAGDVIMDIDRILINLETLTKAFDTHILEEEAVSDTSASFLHLIRDQLGSMRTEIDRLIVRV